MNNNIIVFTLHKSASMFLHQQCEFLSKKSGLDYHSPNLPGTDITAQRLLTDPSIWQSRNSCFAPIRFYVPVPDINQYNIILHLRDPRDVLVSMFYSYCYIHNGEIQGNTGYRKEVADRGIDAFVLDKASENSSDYRGDYGTGGHVESLIGNLPKRYIDYIDHLLCLPNVTLLKYEEMVTDYRSWLEKFIASFPVEDKAQVIAELVTLSPRFFPKLDDDAMNHVRHVTPGDHRNKLKPETIQQLNVIFSSTLDALGYSR